MIKRFSLYGFLKNQRYFEPFIILFFLDRGLSFTQIGLLIAFRELFINLLEVPSGAVADLFGRRRSMIIAFVAYIVAFAVFGFSQLYWHFFIAMFFFAIGEAFRTGTHKAMIFTWLRLEGRSDEKTRVYGYTRSWSKIGSAVSVILATAFVLLMNNYAYVFFFSIVPYVAALANFMTYPRELEGQPEKELSLRQILAHLGESIRATLVVRRLRRLIVESMAFEGVFKAAADYLQPVLRNAALLIPILIAWEDTRRSAILVGVVYLILYLFSAYASRSSHRVVHYAGGEEEGSRLLWRVVFLLYLALVPLLFFGYYYVAIIGFIALYVVQNFWRPILISRFDAFATDTAGATILSIESQAKSVSIMIVAPILGVLVDWVRVQNFGGEFWPVGAVAAIITLLILVTPLKGSK